MRLRFDLSMLDFYQGGELCHGLALEMAETLIFILNSHQRRYLDSNTVQNTNWTLRFKADLAGILIVRKCLVNNVPFNLFPSNSNATITANGHRPIGSEV